MSTRGPSQVSSNGLVFYYDTFNNKSYFGKPTKNYCAFTPAYVNWNSQDITTTTISSEVLQIQSTSNVAVQAIWWSGFNPAGESNSGIKLSYSVYVRGKGSVSIQMHQANTSPNAGQDAVGSSTIVLDSNAWTRLSLTNIYMASGVTSCNILIYLTGGTGNYVQVKNVQIEFNDYPTQYVNGTRSATNGLIDLIGSNTINLTNAGFDSNANLTFDGSTKYIDCSGLTKAATCTFEAWAKTTTLANSPMLFNAGNNGAGPDLFFYSNQIHWNTWDGGNNPFGSTPSSVTNGKYHHYVVVNDAGSNAKLYYDGSLLGTATYRTAAATTRLIVGGEPAGYLWTGDIPLFSVYNRALTQSEVLQNFNRSKSRYGL